jgi:arabinose-5-phosphate isomerase
MARLAVSQLASTGASSISAVAAQEHLAFAADVLRREAEAIQSLIDRLDGHFLGAVEQVLNCAGSVIVCGIGKAGLVGRKLSATFASTGTCSHFLHPAEAIHGDLGMVTARDVMLVLSYSGETEELVRVLPSLRRQSSSLIAMTKTRTSSLGRQADLILELGEIREACSLKLAPSSSTAAMMALGDALALSVSRIRGFATEDFAKYHPGGNLGRMLMRAEEAMRPLSQCRVATCNQTVREILVTASRPGRRTGAIMLTDGEGRICGIFTDSDLAKMLEQRRESVLDGPVADVMTKRFLTVQRTQMLNDALQLLARYKISELPVVDEEHRPCGIIDITDMVGIIAEDKTAVEPVPAPRILKMSIPDERQHSAEQQESAGDC